MGPLIRTRDKGGTQDETRDHRPVPRFFAACAGWILKSEIQVPSEMRKNLSLLVFCFFEQRPNLDQPTPRRRDGTKVERSNSPPHLDGTTDKERACTGVYNESFIVTFSVHISVFSRFFATTGETTMHKLPDRNLLSDNSGRPT